jgi:hypothetical protein
MGFLAIIGLIAILIVLTKFLKVVGNAFEYMSTSLSNGIISRTYPKGNIPVKYEKINTKINAIKTTTEEQEYNKAVLEEIEEMTDNTEME